LPAVEGAFRGLREQKRNAGTSAILRPLATQWTGCLPDSRRDVDATGSLPMMLVLSVLLALAPLAGIAGIVMNGTITTVDGLFMSIIMLALSGILFLNVYLEAKKKFILKKAPQAQKTS
jgi:hypothetical protein